MAPLPKLSVREKILVYLAEVAGLDAGRGLASTQIGVASATGQHRGHVSRALKSLAQEGLVDRERRRVAGFTRTLLVFAPTAAGCAAARSLRQGLETLVVEVRGPGAPPQNRPLGEALRQAGCGLWDALRQLEADGFLGAGVPTASRPASEHVWDLEDAPVVHDFVGRSEELARLSRWMRTLEPSCTVEGPGGIGKSSLVMHAIQRSRPPRHVLWVRLSPRMNPELVLARLGGFLARLGRSLTAASSAVPEAVLEGLPERIRGLPVLLVFDDVQKADPSLHRAFERFAAAANRRGDLKVVWVGRSLALPVEALRRALRLDLAPLTRAESLALLGALAIPEDRLVPIAERSGGNPLFLELLAAGRDVRSAQEDFVRHLTDHLERRASPPTLALLEHLCALRAPVTREVLGRLDAVAGADLDGLVRDRLVSPLTDGSLWVHDEVREALYARLDARARRRVHEAWARAFEPRAQLDGVLEYLHHLTRAGRRSDAAWWTLRNQTRLLLWARGRFRTADGPPSTGP